MHEITIVIDYTKSIQRRDRAQSGRLTSDRGRGLRRRTRRVKLSIMAAICGKLTH